MDGGNKKWAWPFRWIFLLYLKNEPMNWADLLHADTNLWKLKVTLIIIGWVWSKMGEVLKIVGLLNQAYLLNGLMNWTDWLNDFCMLIVMEYYFFALNDALYWLNELYVWVKCASQVIGQNAQYKSDCRIF